jgi:hypothetical protein
MKVPWWVLEREGLAGQTRVLLSRSLEVRIVDGP